MSLPILVRPATEADRGIVFTGWRDSFSTSAWARNQWPGDYPVVVGLVLDKVIPGCRVWMGALERDPLTSVGWLALLGGKAEFLFVKKPYALDEDLRAAIGAKLLGHAGVERPPTWHPIRALERLKHARVEG